MFYEKLMNIYHKSECVNFFPETVLSHFAQYIRQSANLGISILSPYRFTLDFNVPLRDSIKFFMFFTDDGGILLTKYFFECSNSGCHSNRIYLDQLTLNLADETLDDPIICDECGREYLLSSVIPYIKVYFEIKDDFEIPASDNKLIKGDCNSTFEAFEGLPNCLKIESPSSTQTFEVPIHKGEGDKAAIDLMLISEINESLPEKQLISPKIPSFNVLRNTTSFIRG